MLSYIYWDPAREMFSWDLPILGRPILWYGFFFALGFFVAYWVAIHLLKESKQMIDKMMLYIILGTVIGAKLGDILFYEHLTGYINDPFALFRIWEGGLASHGGVLGVILALYFCAKKQKVSSVRLLDMIAIPSCIVAGCIRIGNFFNQEILGTSTTMPWGVIFGHPADGGPIGPRHPAQLYEALFYFFLFFLLYFFRKHLKKEGKTSGSFLFLVFSFRFFIEFFKVEQSVYLAPDSLLTMGQILSLPLIAFGSYLYFKK